MKDLNAYDKIRELEQRANAKIDNRRLRSYLAMELQRAYDSRLELNSKISAVLNGFDVYDPKQKKSIYLSEKEKG